MRDILGESLRKRKITRGRNRWLSAVLLLLSLVVIFEVFWVLRQPGLALAGDASCGFLEHTHGDACAGGEEPCGYEEHVHSITCYSDETADVETALDWQQMFADYPYTGNLRQDLVGIAQTQVGYSESALNFEVDDAGNRHGYTRYGAWYGVPYGDWSAMFVSFCLNYAGADPNEAPGNMGAASMETNWEALGKYAAAGEYQPAAGDLVFFADNRVGIVSAVQTATIYVICGDIDGAVCGMSMSMQEPSITGWGLTELEGQSFSFKTARTVTDIIEYLVEYEGSYELLFMKEDGTAPPKDENNNYIVKPDIPYELTFSVESPNGFHPGTYQYQLPRGLYVNPEIQSIVLNGTEVGFWEANADGLITIFFNDKINNRSDVTVSAVVDVKFPAQDEPLYFDGGITVTIEKPPQKEDPTELYKWGSQGKEGNGTKTDPSKLYWTVNIIGNGDSNIPGNVVTDKIVQGDLRYTESDMEGGLRIGVSQTDPETGLEIAWHVWTVYPGDPGLTWTETEWSYQIPETAECENCQGVELGNDGWIYYIEYTSTPTPTGVAGTEDYANRAEVDGQQREGWVNFVHGASAAKISKSGSFHGDAEGGKFLWEFQALIPGRKEGQKTDYFWYIMDYMRIRNHDNEILGYTENNANIASVTATRGDTTVEVPNVKYAGPEDLFAWSNPWSDVKDGIYYHRQLDLLSRCQCTEESCCFWDGQSCSTKYWIPKDDGGAYLGDFCQCWAVEEDTTFTFSYETDDISIVETYGGLGNELQNEVLLFNRTKNPSGDGTRFGRSEAEVLIPGVFKKEMLQEFDGYRANYLITVNEAKLALTDGDPLTIHDVMTETLAYISGSLVITAEDADGNKVRLQQDADYTVTYDGTGQKKDKSGNPVHVLDIVILRPQPVMYVLDYDTSLIIPPGTKPPVKYSNSATITLWGKDLTDKSEEINYTEINISANTYQVELDKRDSLEGAALAGATFGLFNAEGGLITSDVTKADGKILFETNVIQGIILREHVLYYLQELDAPPGYQLDDTKYWFCFCNLPEDACETCESVRADTNALRIPYEQIGIVTAANERRDYDLPATGGPGTYPLVFGCAGLILISIICGFIRNKKINRKDLKQ